MASFFTFFIISFLLTLVILVAASFINVGSGDFQKGSAYECGFEPYGDSRSAFDVHFYVIGLLFIIFDLEIVFLVPFIIDLGNMSIFSYFVMLIFMTIILAGFYYEWAIGLLNWVPKEYSKNDR